MNKYEKALRSLLADIDYDTLKYLEMPEDGGPDRMPAIAEQFEALVNEDLSRSVTVGGEQTTTAHIAAGLAFLLDQEELVANGAEWFITDDCVADGDKVTLVAHVGRDDSATVVLRVESVTTR